MSRELEKYGIQMPAFSRIGGILTNEVRGVLVASQWDERASERGTGNVFY